METPIHLTRTILAGSLVLLALVVAACTANLDEDAPEPLARQSAATEAALAEQVDAMPELIGGLAGVAEKIRYPEEAKEHSVEGQVLVQFLVDEQGTVSRAEVMKGIGGGCDEEALRVVKTLRFVPAKKAGAAVPMQLTLPITFKLPPPPENTAR